MRTFSEAEARAVFARAAREQQEADEAGASGEGLTLDELQEIGRASGLDPAFVAAAAAGLSTSAAARPTPTLLGMPTEVKRSRVLPGPLSDEVWEESVDALRTLFGGPGTASQIGRVREWRSMEQNGWSGGLETRLSARPLPDGRTRVHVEQAGLKGNVWGMIGSAGVPALVALIPLVTLLTGTNGAPPLTFAAVFAAFALALGVGGTSWMKRSARTTGDRFEAALDRIDLLARTDAPAARLEAPDLGDTPEGEAHATVRDARLGLDALGEAPDEAPQRSGPTRARS